MSGQPWLWLIAGPNGAGKSTYAPNLAANVEEIVTPDELAYALAGQAPQAAAFQAGRLAVRRRTELLDQRRSFAVETTLSGRRHLEIIQRARAEGWSVGVVYIGLGSPDLAVERVRGRVSQGGTMCRRPKFADAMNEVSKIWPPFTSSPIGFWCWIIPPHEVL